MKKNKEYLFEDFSNNLQKRISSKTWRFCVAFLIILNTVVIGMETYPFLMEKYKNILLYIDKKILQIFFLEIGIRIIAYRKKFFTDPWSIFDFIIVFVAFIPAQESFSALRAARALRGLRLISIFPSLRKVIDGLVLAIPGICAIASVMAIILLVFGLIASKLYGNFYPQWFGNLHLSIFSLFQIMTLEGWPDIVRTVMEEKQFSWMFFITYILIATFSVLNLFIAVVVDAMQRNQIEKQDDDLKNQEIIKKLDFLIEKSSKQ